MIHLPSPYFFLKEKVSKKNFNLALCCFSRLSLPHGDGGGCFSRSGALTFLKEKAGKKDLILISCGFSRMG